MCIVVFMHYYIHVLYGYDSLLDYVTIKCTMATTYCKSTI